MGSFANSLHVRSDDYHAVAEAVKKALLAEAYEPTDEQLDDDARWGMSPSLRGIHISEPRQGWVSILENDPMSSVALAVEVSQRLKTHAIQFFVNDSDSWHYQLFHEGRQVDAFDSAEDELGEWDDEDLDDTAGMISAGGLGGFEETIRGKAQEFEKLLTAGMPPEIQEVHHKIQLGQATQAETQQYLQWASAEMPKRLAEMQRLIGEAIQGLGQPKGGGRDQSTGDSETDPDQGNESLSGEDTQRLLPHVEHLRPLLASDTPKEHVLAVLGRQAVFAEEVLAEFLPLVGIAPVYANLSYRYLEEFSQSELASQSVKMAEQLRFRSGFEDE